VMHILDDLQELDVYNTETGDKLWQEKRNTKPTLRLV
jgi:outer membrane protein assembly factor BamB